jgi:hypothetical protein
MSVLIHFMLNQCCGSDMFIPDPGSEFFHPGSRIQRLKDPGSASKNLSIFKPEKLFLSCRIPYMIWDVHPGSGSRFFSHPGSCGKKAQDPRYGTLCSVYFRSHSPKDPDYNIPVNSLIGTE